MDTVLLSRIQFAVTTLFHILFPTLTIGLSVLLVVVESPVAHDQGRTLLPPVPLLGKLLCRQLRRRGPTKIKEIFEWDDNVYTVALLSIGYPAESPAPRKSLKLEEIMIE